MWRLACASLVLAAIGCGGDSTPTAAPAQPAASAVAEATPAKATPADAKVVAPAVPDAATPLAAVTKTPTDPSDPCSAAAFDLPAGTVIATVNGAPIRSDALGDDAREAEREALTGYCNEIHRIRTAATQRAIDDHLLAEAARAKGVDSETLVREHLGSAVVTPDAAEIEAFYNANKTAQAPPLETVRGQVEEAIVKERSQVAYDELRGSLRKTALVETTLPEVRPPAYDLATPEHTATFGPKTAAVQLVEFSDFECPYCSRAAEAVAVVKAKFGDEIQFSYRHFPLSFHPAAQPAAEMSQCAQEQDKFWPFHDQVFAGQSGGLTPDGLRSMATEAGLDIKALDECLASGRARTQVQQDMAKAREVGVRGTPAFYINGRAYEGSAEQLVSAIEQQLRG